jgi:hypothetical protein
MALVIEDGTGLPNSNTYVGFAEYRAYATARGIELPVDDAELEPDLIKAMDYLEAQRGKYQGTKTHPGVQALQWPRVGVIIDCSYELPDNVIPIELKNAQMQGAIESFTGNDLMPSSDGRVVKKEKVDVIEREFMTGKDLGTGGLPSPSFPSIDALLDPLFAACGSGGFVLRTVRV